MKQLLLLLFLAISLFGSGQTLKKKYFGTYEGTIPGYSMDIGADVVDVKPVMIIIELNGPTLVQSIGKTVQRGTYTVNSSERGTFTLLFTPENSLVTETITLYTKGKRLVRNGVYPQPAAELKKL